MAVSNPVTLGLMWVRGCETQCYRDHSDTGPWLRGLYCTSLPFCPVVSVHCLAFLQQLRKRVSKCKQPLHKNMLFQASSNAIHPKATTVSATVMHRCLGCTRSAYPHHPTSTVIHRMVSPTFSNKPTWCSHAPRRPRAATRTFRALPGSAPTSVSSVPTWRYSSIVHWLGKRLPNRPTPEELGHGCRWYR